MSISVMVTPVVGLPSLTGWAQVVRNHTGDLICAYALKAESAHNLGRDLADFITQSEPFDAVTLHQFVLDVLAKTRRAEAELQIACILIQSDQLFLAAHQGQILYRSPSGDAKVILNAEHEPQLIEGRLKPGAAFVAATQSAMSQSQRILDLLVNHADADTTITTILPHIHSSAHSDLSALAFTQLPLVIDGEMAPPQPQKTQMPLTAPSRKLGAKATSSAAAVLGFLANITQKTWQFTSKKVWPVVKAGSSQLWHTYQNIPSQQKRKLHLALAGIVVILGLSLLVVRWQTQKAAAETLRVDQELQPIQTLITEAKQLETENPIAARDKAAEAQMAIQKLIDAKSTSTIAQKKYAAILQETQALSTHVSGLKELQTLPVFFDLRLTEPNFLANKVMIQGNLAYFLDQERKQFVALDLTKKQSSVLPLGTLGNVVDFAPTASYLYLLGNGIERWALGEGQKSLESLKTSGDSDKEATLLRSYSSYLYVFNPNKRNVFRYTLGSGSTKATASAKISDPIGWIVNKKDLDFSQVTTMSVDGDIWVGTKTGQILKYTSGQPVSWSVTGLKTPFDSTILLDTDDSLTKLYVLEPTKQRLVILDKTGQFLKELKSPTLASVTTFAVSETLQKAFMVSGSIVYELAL